MKKEKKNPKKNVKSLISKADEAYENEFFLEASILTSSIIEARLRTLITRVEKANPGTGFNLEQCLKRIKYLHLSGRDPVLCKHIEVRLIDDLRTWKNQRNAILKDLAEIHISRKRIENLAHTGVLLQKEFTLAYKEFKKDWKKSLMKRS